MGVSERRVGAIARASAEGKPLGKLIPSVTSLDNVKQATRAARATLRAEKTARTLTEKYTRTDIITALPGEEKAVAAALKRAEKGKARPDDAKPLRRAQRSLELQHPKEPGAAPRELTEEEIANLAGFAFYYTLAEAKKNHPGGKIASRPFNSLDDAINKCKHVDKNYFAIVKGKQTTPSGKVISIYHLFDVRDESERKVHDRKRVR